MAAHGGGGATTRGIRSPGKTGVCGPAVVNGATPGFRHVFGKALCRPDQRFGLYQADLPALHGVMARLATRMRFPTWPNQAARDNPRIPSGYTYFGQFVAHDLVQSAIPASVMQASPLALYNNRIAQLRLDSLFGSGPDDSPMIYTIDNAAAMTRSRLRVGPITAEPDVAAGQCPFRDIVRAQFTNGPTPAPTIRKLTEAVVADPRNDDHAILSQLTVLFHYLYNGIVELLQPAAQVAIADTPQDAYQRFLCARGATASIYRNIIRCDLLEKILHPAIYQRYNTAAPALLDDHAPGMPLEFSHGAYRFGHAMVRDDYQINERSRRGINLALQRTSMHSRGGLPLDRSWIVQWGHFFELLGVPTNLSQRIGPQFSAGLEIAGGFDAIDDSRAIGLAYRDLISASTLGLWSVDALVNELRNRASELVALSPWLFDATKRGQVIADWLGQDADGRGIRQQDIVDLAKDPPLPFFILLEAAHTTDGTSLGILGSVIVAEVMFGALMHDPLPWEQGAATLQEALRNLSGDIYRSDRLAAVPEIRTMGELIHFTATANRLSAATPAFL